MKRVVRYACRFLARKVKQLLPLALITCAFIIIPKDHTSASLNAPNPLVPRRNIRGHNSTLQLRTENTSTSQQLISTEPYSNYSIRGERNAAKTRDYCRHHHGQPPDVTLTVRWSKNNSLLFCPIYKVGTTFWRRVFMIQREKKYSHLDNPYLIPFDKDYAGSKFLLKRDFSVQVYKVMFTREPYNRLYSFFVDKLLAPNPYFWKSVGVEVAAFTRKVPRKVLKTFCGHDVTFTEFIKYVIHTLETRHNIDPHWIEMEKNCRPCEMKYNFIGQMENFNEDSLQIIHKLGLEKMASVLEKNGKDASVDDAIRDTLSQPFTFRVKYKRCTSFKDALLRAWKKLQIRGLIGNSTLDGLLIDDKMTKLNDVISRALASRDSSTSRERLLMKNKNYIELWKSVDETDLHKLKELYSRDFELFGYNSMPPELFRRRTAI